MKHLFLHIAHSAKHTRKRANTTTNVMEGRSFPLAIARAIIEAHNSTIAVASNGLEHEPNGAL